jgi:broad specificity phosphatase PhoE
MATSRGEGQQRMCPSSMPQPQRPSWDVVVVHDEHGSSIVLLLVLMMVGMAMGVLLTLSFVYIYYYRTRTKNALSLQLQNSSSSSSSLAMLHAEDCRRRLPDTIILIRHGESQANADPSLWIAMPDNLLGLTQRGHEQAAVAGRRVEEILQHVDQEQYLYNNEEKNNNNNNNNAARVHLVVSPFERSLQTAASLRPALEHRIVRTDIESRIREQEMGNLQCNATLFQTYRHEQQRVGRFWYRFPTGESGSDVLDRVKSWWYESIQTVNTRVGYEPVQAIVVVSHGASCSTIHYAKSVVHVVVFCFGFFVWTSFSCLNFYESANVT